MASAARPLKPHAAPPLPAVQQYFEISLFLLVSTGVLAIVSTGTTANVALGRTAPSGLVAPTSSADIYNSGSADVAVAFGNSSVTAVTPVAGTPGNYVIPKGTLVKGVPVPPGADHMAAIGAGTVYVTPNF